MILENTKLLALTKNCDTREDDEKLRYAAEILKRGGLVAFPTETVYGLGANAFLPEAVKGIYAAKGRPNDNPLILHVGMPEDIQTCCVTEGNVHLSKLVAAGKQGKPLIPGPLTVILPKRASVPDCVTAGLPNVAARVPSCVAAHRFLVQCGVPVAAPSANRSGRPSCTTAEHVYADMDGRIDVILDGGPCDVGVESTVVTLVTDPPALLRPGGTSYEALVQALGSVTFPDSVLETLQDGETPPCPGMKYKHYAPEAPVSLVVGDDDAVIAYFSQVAQDGSNAILCYTEEEGELSKLSGRIFAIGSKDCPEDYAHSLFAALRRADETAPKAIYARMPQDRSGISLALVNRLLKAAGYHVVTAGGNGGKA